MIEIGCVANFNIPYSSEIEFVRENNFELVQIWYDKDGIALYGSVNPMELIKSFPYPSIIHAVLDINEFVEHIPKLYKILKELGHKELIIHPVCKSETYSKCSIETLNRGVSYAYEMLTPLDITIYIENNSRLDPLLHTAEEVAYLFDNNPGVKFILDIAHIRDYDHLKTLVDAKFPEMLHVADKHFDVLHEHLPIGQGELNFSYIFERVLKEFRGKLILEITQSREDLIRSKEIMEELLNSREGYVAYEFK